jgi:Subtilase family
MADRDKRHIVVDDGARSEPYGRPPRKMDAQALPTPSDRFGHGSKLVNELNAANSSALTRRDALGDASERASGIYLTFESFPGVDLALESMDPRRGDVHPVLVAVRGDDVDGVPRTLATIYVPDGKLGYFLSRLTAYLETADSAEGKNRNLVDRVAHIGVASLEHLWTDHSSDFPDPAARVWWELWLRRRHGQELAALNRFLTTIGARTGRFTLTFPDRTVAMVEATAQQLASALDVLDDVAELRRPPEPATPLASEPPSDHADWVAQLAERLTQASEDAPTACILDSGVYQPHPLLVAGLDESDCHGADASWGAVDDDGHGTEMAGLALFGDMGAAILGAGEIALTHRLESVKILPRPPAETRTELYGAVTAAATSRVEVQKPHRARVFSLAITAGWNTVSPESNRRKGEPTSWSASIDALAAGLEIDITDTGLLTLKDDDVSERRLFLISAGNVREDDDDHLTRSDVEPIEDPAQAWNALTIGAYTDLVDASSSPGFEGWTPLAPAGELSPFSRTGVAFARAWPHKPDVVLEGGNLARSPDGDFDQPDSLQILTTRAPLMDQRLLTVTNATSAATAQAAFLAASIKADNPGLWPETVRALVVHSAEWTVAMRAHFGGGLNRTQKVALLRRYGMGVPDLGRATRSASDALTLIAQDVVRPFSDGQMREMNLHELPWPTDVLSSLGDVEVTLRVTLSYFIEPNPARRGWVRRYSYASHGLRFDVRRATETTPEFRERINAKARDPERPRSVSDSDTSSWFFGRDQRVAGSLHSDIWRGTAADLAARSVIGVYPVSGWWKEQKARDHSDRGACYALVVSIETPDLSVDIYTPVAQQMIEEPVETET